MNKNYTMLIFCIITIVAGIGIAMFESNKASEYQSELSIVVETKKFLKTKVNYPNTFDFVNYPNVDWYEDDIVYVVVSGKFKSANAFGVYSEHKFAVAINPKNLSVITYQIS